MTTFFSVVTIWTWPLPTLSAKTSKKSEVSAGYVAGSSIDPKLSSSQGGIAERPISGEHFHWSFRVVALVSSAAPFGRNSLESLSPSFWSKGFSSMPIPIDRGELDARICRDGTAVCRRRGHHSTPCSFLKSAGGENSEQGFMAPTAFCSMGASSRPTF